MTSLFKEVAPDERDQATRSTKKFKRNINHLIFNNDPNPITLNNSPSPSVSFPPLLNSSVAPVTQTHIPPSFRDIAATGQIHHQPLPQVDDEADDISDDDEPPEQFIDNPCCPAILLSKEEKKRIRQPWRNTLIIKLFNAKIGYMSLMKRLKKKWELKGGMILTDIGHDYFIARFSDMRDYNHVLTQGPWMLDDNYLTIRKWIPNFIPDDTPLRFLTAWVRIPHLSVEYFDKEFLHKIGSRIGKVMRIDTNTLSAQRGQFTRLSVELDLSKPLLSKFWLKGKIWQIQYEGLKMICFTCGKIGHQQEKCPSLHMEYNTATTSLGNIINEEIIPSVEKQTFGDWMMVKKPPRRQYNRKDKPPQEAVQHQSSKLQGGQSVPEVGQLGLDASKPAQAGGSRFHVLETDGPNSSPDPQISNLNGNLKEGNLNLAHEQIVAGNPGLTQSVTFIDNPIFSMGNPKSNPPKRVTKGGNSRKILDLNKSSKNVAPKSILKEVTNF